MGSGGYVIFWRSGAMEVGLGGYGTVAYCNILNYRGFVGKGLG